jgi:hypothetical protein
MLAESSHNGRERNQYKTTEARRLEEGEMTYQPLRRGAIPGHRAVIAPEIRASLCDFKLAARSQMSAKSSVRKI